MWLSNWAQLIVIQNPVEAISSGPGDPASALEWTQLKDSKVKKPGAKGPEISS